MREPWLDGVVTKASRRHLYAAVEAERERQDAKWGPAGHGHDLGDMSAVLGEEFGEVCKASLEADTDGLKEELIQVAAVALKWIECIEADEDAASAPQAAVVLGAAWRVVCTCRHAAVSHHDDGCRLCRCETFSPARAAK